MWTVEFRAAKLDLFYAQVVPFSTGATPATLPLTPAFRLPPSPNQSRPSWIQDYKFRPVMHLDGY